MGKRNKQWRGIRAFLVGKNPVIYSIKRMPKSARSSVLLMSQDGEKSRGDVSENKNDYLHIYLLLKGKLNLFHILIFCGKNKLSISCTT